MNLSQVGSVRVGDLLASTQVCLVLIVVVTEVVVGVLLLSREVSAVSGVALVSLSWRNGHVVGICGPFAIAAFAFGDCRLRILIEAHDWEDDDLVVEKGAKDEKDESNDGLPIELLESKSDGCDPDHNCPGGVDSRALSCRSVLCGCDSTNVEAGDGNHDTDG